MKIGFIINPRKDIIKEIEWIGKNKFDFVDLILEEDEAVYDKIDVEKVKNSLHKYRLDAIGHTAWYLPIGSPVKSLREAAIKELIKYFEVFQKIGVHYVTIHANWPGNLFSIDEGIDFQVESLTILVQEAEKHNLELLYEPLDGIKDNIKNISKILNKVPKLFFHLDIGHANIYGKKPEKFIKKFNEKLKHVHLNDNTRDLDLHLPMECGNINWTKTIKILKKYYNGTITLEIFSKNKDYVLLSREKLRKYWESL